MYNVVKTEKTALGRFEITLDTIEKNDEIGYYSYVSIKPGVCVIPIICGEGILIEKEYRHAIKSWEYQFPCGMIDDLETPDHAAERELKEETGFVAEKLYSLGSYFPSFGSTTEKIYMFAALCEQPRGKCHLDLMENISTFIVTEEEIDKLISQNLFSCGSAMVAWLKWKIYRDKNNMKTMNEK